MKKLCLLLLSLLLILFFIVQFKFFSVIPISKAGESLAASRSKEFCSCYFVQSFNEKYCLDKVLKGYPLFDYQIDEKTKSVLFSNPLGQSVSMLDKNSNFGCFFP